MSSSGGSSDSDGEQQRPEDWDDWQDEENMNNDDNDGEYEPTKSLFEDVKFPNPQACMDHDASKHSFDLRVLRRQVRVCVYICIMHTQAYYHVLQVNQEHVYILDAVG